MQCYKCNREIGTQLGLCAGCKAQSEASRARNLEALYRRGGDETPETGQAAGFWLRVLASFVDAFVANILLLVVSIAILVPLFELSLNTVFYSWSLRLVGAATPTAELSLLAIILGSSVALGLSFMITLLVGSLLYNVAFEASPLQATPGKLLLGICVVNEQGERISPKQALGRTAAKFLSTLPLCLGYLMVAFRFDKQGLHDILAKTYVIKTLRYRPVNILVALVTLILLGLVTSLFNSNDARRAPRLGQRLKFQSPHAQQLNHEFEQAFKGVPEELNRAFRKN